MIRYFCTYFDQYYLPRGLALYRSLKRHCRDFQLWILCLDGTSHSVLANLQLPELHLIRLEDFERNDEALRQAKLNRTTVEYYFTCTPSLPLFVFRQCPDIGLLTYLDADLFFFADPASLYDELGERSIAIIEHRFPPRLRYCERNGIYNVGWLSFRRDTDGLSCLNWWRDRCIEWCYDRYEDGRYADQKYLDAWPERFKGVTVLKHKGANLAPWNLANYAVHSDGDRVWVDEQPLLFFHFQGFKQLTPWLYDPNLARYGVRLSKAVRQGICAPYIEALSEIAHNGRVPRGIRDASSRWPKFVRDARTLLRIAPGILTRRYLVCLSERVV
ncbi:MAG TPA: glycosyl transferase [Candidatus Margulisiibacteriota bacterium]|nr:glycosyl transferase [Candidatus Margulisiibacteriota bacterium]